MVSVQHQRGSYVAWEPEPFQKMVPQRFFSKENGSICKVVEISITKNGKHGHAKASIVGIDIFTGKKYEDSCPSSHSIEAPFVSREEYQIADIGSDGFITLILEDGMTREDLKFDDTEENQHLKDKLQEELTNGKDIILGIMVAMGEEKIIDYREIS